MRGAVEAHDGNGGVGARFQEPRVCFGALSPAPQVAG